MADVRRDRVVAKCPAEQNEVRAVVQNREVGASDEPAFVAVTRVRLSLVQRVRVALNYVIVVFAAMFASWFALMPLPQSRWDGWIFGIDTALVVVAFVELVGRRPYVALSRNRIEIRNFGSAQTVDPDDVLSLSYYASRLGKDTCVALQTSERRIPVFAWIGADIAEVRSKLRTVCPNLEAHEPSVARRAWRWLTR